MELFKLLGTIAIENGAANKEIDEILQVIIQKDKILEVNSSTKGMGLSVTSEEILQRYYQLGGRKISFASDAIMAGSSMPVAFVILLLIFLTALWHRL